MASSIHNMW